MKAYSENIIHGLTPFLEEKLGVSNDRGIMYVLSLYIKEACES